ncbi:MAG: membrane protein insertion efficiency factor YidD [Bifidobacteriaceae bacterium]|jgi:putative membrane protein insertion efficiency factor|nr:membrane protein insertion efficiency factor YidD [Bifidobacteriaceae bacterium]
MIVKQIINLIEFYQESISSARPAKCKYHPSCSEFMKECVLGYGALIGLLLGLFRLIKCNPASGGGFDFVPEKINLFGIQLEKKEKLV